MNESRHDLSEVLGDVVRALVNGDDAEADARMATIATEPRPAPRRRNPGARALAEIYERDRYHCRYCGKKTVLVPVMRLISVAYPDEFPYHKNWKSGAVHPAVELIGATHDHVVPVARGGGSDSPDNIVTACWVCNSAKGNLSLDALGWSLRDPADEAWHGLADLYPRLREVLGLSDMSAYEREWLNAVTLLYGEDATR